MQNKFTKRGNLYNCKKEKYINRLECDDDNNKSKSDSDVNKQKVLTTESNSIGKSEIIKVFKHQPYLGGTILSSMPVILEKKSKKPRNNITFNF